MKQLSVFLENKEGRLNDALLILKNEDINIVSLSLADTADYGMLRLIVSDAEKGRALLKDNGFSAHISDVIAVKMPHVPGSLQRALQVISQNGFNVEYLYALCTKTDEAAIVFKSSDNVKTLEVLEGSGFKSFSDEDLF